LHDGIHSGRPVHSQLAHVVITLLGLNLNDLAHTVRVLIRFLLNRLTLLHFHLHLVLGRLLTGGQLEFHVDESRVHSLIGLRQLVDANELHETFWHTHRVDDDLNYIVLQRIEELEDLLMLASWFSSLGGVYADDEWFVLESDFHDGSLVLLVTLEEDLLDCLYDAFLAVAWDARCVDVERDALVELDGEEEWVFHLVPDVGCTEVVDEALHVRTDLFLSRILYLAIAFDKGFLERLRQERVQVGLDLLASLL
jgi:hypothetical protein